MTRTLLPAVGVIGLGSMGGHFARRLLRAGYPVRVLDLRPESVSELRSLGADAAATPRELGDSCDVVCLSLPRPSDVEATVLADDGVLEGSRFAAVIDLSTTGPAVARKVAAALAARGRNALDAPVSGGPHGAEAGTLCIMVAGDGDAFERFRPLLETLGRTVVHLGADPGQGQMMKIINNTISASCMTASCEGLALGTKAGLDPEAMIEVLNASTARNSHTEDKIPRCVLTGRFDFGFQLALMLKDVRLCLEVAQGAEAPMLMAGMTQQLIALQLSQGGLGQDISEIVRLFENWAGVEVRGRGRIAAD